MQTLTKEEFEKNTTRKQTRISIDLDELEIDESMTVWKHEWEKLNLKSKISAYIHNIGKPKKFKIRALKSGAGWSVLRLK